MELNDLTLESVAGGKGNRGGAPPVAPTVVTKEKVKTVSKAVPVFVPTPVSAPQTPALRQPALGSFGTTPPITGGSGGCPGGGCG